MDDHLKVLYELVDLGLGGMREEAQPLGSAKVAGRPHDVNDGAPNGATPCASRSRLEIRRARELMLVWLPSVAKMLAAARERPYSRVSLFLYRSQRRETPS